MRFIRPGNWRWQPQGPARVWLAVADHFEPLWLHPSAEVAQARVALWRREWPRVADACRDSRGDPARYTFFFPAEAYSPEFLDPLAELTYAGAAEVEVHYHHGGESEDRFCSVLGEFTQTLESRHGLLRRRDGKPAFGFIHGNWALANSLPGGAHCGINAEITLLARLGCYADFTMPSGDSPSQARMVNRIYWASGDAARPKSYDWGFPAQPGLAPQGELLMIPGPFGPRNAGARLMWISRYPETGEIASYHRPTPERVQRWLELAPRIGNDIFVKLYAHGAQERHSAVLLGPEGDLARMYRWMAEECRRRGWEYHFVSAWQLFQAVEAALRLTSRASDTAAAPSNAAE